MDISQDISLPALDLYCRACFNVWEHCDCPQDDRPYRSDIEPEDDDGDESESDDESVNNVNELYDRPNKPNNSTGDHIQTGTNKSKHVLIQEGNNDDEADTDGEEQWFDPVDDPVVDNNNTEDDRIHYDTYINFPDVLTPNVPKPSKESTDKGFTDELNIAFGREQAPNGQDWYLATTINNGIPKFQDNALKDPNKQRYGYTTEFSSHKVWGKNNSWKGSRLYPQESFFSAIGATSGDVFPVVPVPDFAVTNAKAYGDWMQMNFPEGMHEIDGYILPKDKNRDDLEHMKWIMNEKRDYEEDNMYPVPSDPYYPFYAMKRDGSLDTSLIPNTHTEPYWFTPKGRYLYEYLHGSHAWELLDLKERLSHEMPPDKPWPTDFTMEGGKWYFHCVEWGDWKPGMINYNPRDGTGAYMGQWDDSYLPKPPNTIPWVKPRKINKEDAISDYDLQNLDNLSDRHLRLISSAVAQQNNSSINDETEMIPFIKKEIVKQQGVVTGSKGRGRDSTSHVKLIPKKPEAIVTQTKVKGMGSTSHVVIIDPRSAYKKEFMWPEDKSHRFRDVDIDNGQIEDQTPAPVVPPPLPPHVLVGQPDIEGLGTSDSIFIAKNVAGPNCGKWILKDIASDGVSLQNSQNPTQYQGKWTPTQLGNLGDPNTSYDSFSYSAASTTSDIHYIFQQLKYDNNYANTAVAVCGIRILGTLNSFNVHYYGHPTVSPIVATRAVALGPNGSNGNVTEASFTVIRAANNVTPITVSPPPFQWIFFIIKGQQFKYLDIDNPLCIKPHLVVTSKGDTILTRKPMLDLRVLKSPNTLFLEWGVNPIQGSLVVNNIPYATRPSNITTEAQWTRINELTVEPTLSKWHYTTKFQLGIQPGTGRTPNSCTHQFLNGGTVVHTYELNRNVDAVTNYGNPLQQTNNYFIAVSAGLRNGVDTNVNNFLFNNTFCYRINRLLIKQYT